MPFTFITFAVGVLAICGIPGFAGFASKEAILGLAYSNNPAIFYMLFAGAGITAFYMTRLFVTVFWGTPRSEQAGEAKENTWVIVLPLLVLAFFSIFGWMHWLYPTSLHGVLVDSIPHAEGAMEKWLPIASVTVAVIGMLLAWFIYKPGSSEDAFEKNASLLFGFIDSKLWFDELYRFYINRIQQPVADFLSLMDVVVLGGLGMRGSAGGVGLFGMVLRFFTTGNVHHYVYWFAAGVILCGAVIFGIR